MKNVLLIFLCLVSLSHFSYASTYFTDFRIKESEVNAPKGIAVGGQNPDLNSMDAFVALSADNAVGQLIFNEISGFSTIPEALTSFSLLTINANHIFNPISIALGYFTGDNQLKLSVFIQDSTLESDPNAAGAMVFYATSSISNGRYTFSAPYVSGLFSFAPVTTGGPEAIAVGRLNSNDSHDDVISVGDRGNPVDASIYAYNSILAPLGSTFELATSSSYPNSIKILDYNRDGIGDYVVTSTGTNSINIVLGSEASGHWENVFETEPSRIISVGSQPWGLAVGDINADGYPDILTADRGSDSVSVVLNNADGTRVSTLNQTIENVCDEPIDVELADFNADGKSDVAVLCTGDGFLKVYPGNGDGTFATTVIFEKNVGSNPFDIVTDDFNADGHADLLVSVTGSNKIVTLLGNDEPTLSNPSVDTTTGVFQITYTDADNEAPASITVTIDGTVTAMTETDASDTTYTDGKIYQATQALSTGSHTYRFAASDGTYDAVGDPSSIVSVDQSLTVSPAAGSGGGCSLSVANSPISALACFASVLVLGASRILRRKEKHSY